MEVVLTNQAPASIAVDVLAVGVSAGAFAKDPSIKALDTAMSGALLKWIETESFKAGLGETLALPLPAGLAASRLLLVGLGKGEVTDAAVRRLGAKASSVAKGHATLAVVAPSTTQDAMRALGEGLATGAYRYTKYLTGDRVPKRSLKTVSIVVPGKVRAGVKEAIDKAIVVAECVNLARDLVNEPPNDLHPTALANLAKSESSKLGIHCQILDKRAIEKQGMNLLLAVARGSDQEPRFIHMVYTPKKAKKKTKKIVFVGKGLTFDSGGLCIKPPKSMLDMKCDMAGGAVTIATVLAAARLELPIEVHGIVPATENMTGGSAFRPGDVFTSLEGKTVEIINTDAEGRLILADALTYAARLEPDVLIDHATLTGACMVALGSYTAGLYANDDALAEKYARAAEAAGESFWRMPLSEDLRDAMKSDIADLKHMGDAYGGSITAALFLREFIGKSKWLHLDIAGPAFGERPHGIAPKGGTGFGVMTAVRFLESLRA